MRISWLIFIAFFKINFAVVIQAYGQNISGSSSTEDDLLKQAQAEADAAAAEASAAADDLQAHADAHAHAAATAAVKQVQEEEAQAYAQQKKAQDDAHAAAAAAAEKQAQDDAMAMLDAQVAAAAAAAAAVSEAEAEAAAQQRTREAAEVMHFFDISCVCFACDYSLCMCCFTLMLLSAKPLRKQRDHEADAFLWYCWCLFVLHFCVWLLFVHVLLVSRCCCC